MRVDEAIIVSAPVEAVWQRVANPLYWPRDLGRMRSEHMGGTPETGVGARYLLHFEVGAVQVGSLIEVTRHEPPHAIDWVAIRGLEQSGSWLLRSVEGGRCKVLLRVRYQAAGGLAALITDEVSSILVRKYVAGGLRALTRRCEDVPQQPDRDALALAGDGLEWLGRLGHRAHVLAGARLLRPLRPDRYARAAAAVARWGQTPAGAYACLAILYPDDPAVIDELGTLTFTEIHECASGLAGRLLADGINEGDRVALMCRNHRWFVVSVIALSMLGANALLLNTGFAGPQLADVFKRERPRAVIHDSEFIELMPSSLPRRRRYVAWTDEGGGEQRAIERAIDEADTTAPAPPELPGRTTILTSGTTGAPKGAARPYAGIRASVSILEAIPLRGRERVLVSAPLFHQWGFAHFSLGLLLASTLVLRRKFDPEDTLATIERERVTCCPMVPVMCQRILDLPEDVRRRYDTSSLRTVPLSGSALSGELASRFMDEFGDVLYNLYGSTEVAWVAIANPKDLRRAPGTVGRPPRDTTVRILDEHGTRALTGQSGRIFVRNDLLFEGYTEGGSKDMLEGLMSTGDVGHFDDHGRLFVDGRDDDMIVSGGENVFPQEVEETLLRHVSVRDAAVIGVEDKEFGQRLKAFVVAGGPIDEQALKQYVKQNLAAFKVPRDVAFVEELPRSEQGKVLKREL
jgi:acyl-CoA synthetase (AMP-forming)/AMP-acid ligase II